MLRNDDDELFDIQGKRRVFKVAPPKDDRRHTKFFLNDPEGGRNIEVLVLRKYLEEVFELRAIQA